MAATPNLQWFARTFCAEALPFNPTPPFWEELERRAAGVPPGADGVMYHPYIDPAGERAPFIDAGARAQFTGLSMQHGRDVLLRAVYEGVALAVLDCYATIGVPLAELRLAGGGARSPLWAQILADALGCPVVVAAGAEHGALGAVINAGVAIGLYATHAEGVARTVRVAQRFEPAAGSAAQYAALLDIYRATAEAMRPVWALRSAHAETNHRTESTDTL
jgi:sugar (pentulose or hexulose) kinase